MAYNNTTLQVVAINADEITIEMNSSQTTVQRAVLKSHMNGTSDRNLFLEHQIADRLSQLGIDPEGDSTTVANAVEGGVYRT
jgi:hypothetical protein